MFLDMHPCCVVMVINLWPFMMMTVLLFLPFFFFVSECVCLFALDCVLPLVFLHSNFVLMLFFKKKQNVYVATQQFLSSFFCGFALFWFWSSLIVSVIVVSATILF